MILNFKNFVNEQQNNQSTLEYIGFVFVDELKANSHNKSNFLFASKGDLSVEKKYDEMNGKSFSERKNLEDLAKSFNIDNQTPITLGIDGKEICAIIGVSEKGECSFQQPTNNGEEIIVDLKDCIVSTFSNFKNDLVNMYEKLNKEKSNKIDYRKIYIYVQS